MSPKQATYLATLLVVGLALQQPSASWAKPPKDSVQAKAKVRSDGEKLHKADEFPEEDTDMLMEPNDFAPISVLRSHEQQYHPAPTAVHRGTVQPQQFQPLRPRQLPVQFSARADVHDSHTQAAQNYYPPFFREAPPLGHSRPYFPIPDSPPIPKYAAPHPQEHLPAPRHGPVVGGGSHGNFDPAILGSGDFGVLRGGTFYPEEEMPYHQEDNNGDFYGDGSTGGPNDGFIQRYTYPEEQFEHFRDFADINTPADSAFSQFVVVYAAKNSTKPSTHSKPKNIFEQLELLDREKEQEEREAKKQQQRTSKSKSKLAKTKLQKMYKKKPAAKDLDYEPLLALS